MHAKKSQNKSVIYAKTFTYFISEGLFKDKDNAVVSGSSMELQIKDLKIEAIEREKQSELEAKEKDL